MSRMQYPDLNGHTAIAMSALRRVAPEMRQHMREADTWNDIVAWAAVGAVEGFKHDYDPKQTYNAAQRYIYRGLRNDGYSRSRADGMRYIRRENDEVSAEMLLRENE